MILRLLLMTAGGIALAQVVIDPHRVRERWLRLAAVLALGLGVAAAVLAAVRRREASSDMAAGFFVPLLVLGQVAALWRRRWLVQRMAAGACLLVFAGLVALGFMAEVTMNTRGIVLLSLVGSLLAAPVACALAGGFLFAALLGHACLEADSEASAKVLRRVVLWLGALLLARLLLSAGTGLAPWWRHAMWQVGPDGVWVNTQRRYAQALAAARYGIGLGMPLVLMLYIRYGVARRWYTTATAALYVAWACVLVGEGMALRLASLTSRVF